MRATAALRQSLPSLLALWAAHHERVEGDSRSRSRLRGVAFGARPPPPRLSVTATAGASSAAQLQGLYDSLVEATDDTEVQPDPSAAVRIVATHPQVGRACATTHPPSLPPSAAALRTGRGAPTRVNVTATSTRATLYRRPLSCHAAAAAAAAAAAHRVWW
eukprot:COSAG01_NODE_2725_length_7180_cov_2.210705_5_plen_161_part_00